MKYQRVFCLVIDSLGVGTSPDASLFNDIGSNTLGHICAYQPLKLPNLTKLGLFNLHPCLNQKASISPIGYYGKAIEASNSKDTLSGHWEMMGIEVKEPFVTFTDTGFPSSLIEELESKCGYKVIGNKAASGTEIIKELGERHIKSKEIIVYTSSDSVLQIAAHEKYFGLDELYRCCEIAREICMKAEYKVGRIIARPFIGEDKNSFERTSNRHDYALKPPILSDLDALKQAGYDVISIGKINDIFAGCGISKAIKSKSSQEGMRQTIDVCKNERFEGLCFVNLVDFDSKWGHRRNVDGYGKELEAFDVLFDELMKEMQEDDLLIITSDHGNDPIHHGSDHTREMTFVLVYSPSLKGYGLLPLSLNFGWIGASILDNFNVSLLDGCIGKSFMSILR